MKHLKYFENDSELPVLKKYVVLNTYSVLWIVWIVEVLDIVQNFHITINYCDKYEYTKSTKQLRKCTNDDRVWDTRYNSNNIAFQSDNIEDCIDMLPILANTNKYNL